MSEKKNSVIKAVERETHKVMLQGFQTPDKLKQKTLAAMKQLREEETKRQSRRKKIAVRVAVAAAILAIAVAATPLNNYVVSAAGDFYNWVVNTFHVGMKKSDNGLTVEIIEARVSKDFLYLTVNESYDVKIY